MTALTATVAEARNNFSRIAEQCASARGVSTEMISPEQYERMFGKKY